MTKKRQPHLFDLVAVVNNSRDSALDVGDVGTVVEELPPDAVEVEFLFPDGRTRTLSTLCVDDVLVLNISRTKVA